MIRELCMLFLALDFISGGNLDEGTTLETVLNTLERVIDFTLAEPKLNIDGLFGISQAEGTMRQIIVEAGCPIIRNRFSLLAARAAKIREIILPTLPTFPHKYEMFNNYILDPALWAPNNITFTSYKINTRTIRPVPTQHDITTKKGFTRYLYYSEFSEEHSDNCIVDILEDTRSLVKHVCYISGFCHEYMISHGFDDRDRGYGAPHRFKIYWLLYLQIARARNCEMNKALYDELAEKLCSYILWEARKIVELGVTNLDLLTEQMGMCGREGFPEFFNKTWLDMVLANQDPEGCFAQASREKRIKREGNEIKNGCSDHTTGLTADYLALYAYYLIKTGGL